MCVHCFMRTCMHACACITFVQTNTQAFENTRIYAHTFTHLYIHTCKHACTHTYILTYIHTYTQVHLCSRDTPVSPSPLPHAHFLVASCIPSINYLNPTDLQIDLPFHLLALALSLSISLSLSHFEHNRQVAAQLSRQLCL